MIGCTTGLACCAWAFSLGLGLCPVGSWPAWLLADVSEDAWAMLCAWEPDHLPGPWDRPGHVPSDFGWGDESWPWCQHASGRPRWWWPTKGRVCLFMVRARIWPERRHESGYDEDHDPLALGDVCALLPVVPRCAPPPVALANEAHRCTEVDEGGRLRCELIAGHRGMHRCRGPFGSTGWGWP